MSKSVKDILLGVKINKVEGSFSCHSNELTSLEGSPKIVGGAFYCSGNELTSLEGGPKRVGGRFICYDNKKQFTIDEVKEYTNLVKGVILV